VNGFARHRNTARPKGGSYLARGDNKFPTKAATTEVWDDDLLRLPLIDVAFFVRHCTDLSNLSVGNQVEGFEDESLVLCGRGLAYVSVVEVSMTQGARSELFAQHGQ
jgi:hypothetical protein